MLDLFDFWFGPLEHTGSSAINAIPCQPTEDAVALSFRTADGASGSALWNFAASHSEDQLVIDGIRGRITMRGTSTDDVVQVDLDKKARIRIGQPRSQRRIADWRRKLGLFDGEIHRFDKVVYPHEAMLKRITAEIVDRSLAPYYGGRDDAFWARPSTWQSLHAKALRRNQGAIPAAYRLTEDELRTIETRGYVGPFRCDTDWQQLVVSERLDHNRHLDEADIFEVCTHPSIIHRVDQVMGRPRFSLFKSRFPMKAARSEKVIPWHQDVGERNGGFAPDGKAVPTLAVFMAIDEMDLGNGGLEVIPGSHKRLLGDYVNRSNSPIVEVEGLSQADKDRAEPFSLKPGEFMIFHGWLLHYSRPNMSDRRRAAMNMRFVPLGLEREDRFTYMPIETADVPLHNDIFMNEIWHGTPNDANRVEAGDDHGLPVTAQAV